MLIAFVGVLLEHYQIHEISGHWTVYRILLNYDNKDGSSVKRRLSDYYTNIAASLEPL